jgi:hypothetical protein
MQCKYSRHGRPSFRAALSALRMNAEPKRSTKDLGEIDVLRAIAVLGPN